MIAARVAHALGARITGPVVDQCHNLVETATAVTFTARARRRVTAATC